MVSILTEITEENPNGNETRKVPVKDNLKRDRDMQNKLQYKGTEQKTMVMRPFLTKEKILVTEVANHHHHLMTMTKRERNTKWEEVKRQN